MSNNFINLLLSLTTGHTQMKLTYIFSILIIMLPMIAFAQEGEGAANYIAKAKTDYSSGNLEETRFTLQQALVEIDMAIGREIMAMLPEQINDMKAVTENDDVNGTAAGFAGLYIDREYRSEGETPQVFRINLINNSPLLAGINTFLTAPLIGAVMGGGRKKIKVDGYKGLLEPKEGSTVPGYTLNIPFGDSLLTFDFEHVSTETEVMGITNQIPVSKIVDMAE